MAHEQTSDQVAIRRELHVAALHHAIQDAMLHAECLSLHDVASDLLAIFQRALDAER